MSLNNIPTRLVKSFHSDIDTPNPIIPKSIHSLYKDRAKSAKQIKARSKAKTNT